MNSQGTVTSLQTIEVFFPSLPHLHSNHHPLIPLRCSPSPSPSPSLTSNSPSPSSLLTHSLTLYTHLSPFTTHLLHDIKCTLIHGDSVTPGRAPVREGEGDSSKWHTQEVHTMYSTCSCKGKLHWNSPGLTHMINTLLCGRTDEYPPPLDSWPSHIPEQVGCYAQSIQRTLWGANSQLLNV